METHKHFHPAPDNDWDKRNLDRYNPSPPDLNFKKRIEDIKKEKRETFLKWGQTHIIIPNARFFITTNRNDDIEY